MQIIKNKLTDISVNYPIEKLASIDELLFIDIETTGFTARSSNLYLIGCVAMEDGEWTATQFFADIYSEESEIITEFFEYASAYKYLVHFNGNNFDIPFIEAKCKEHNLSYSFDCFSGIDIYKRISSYKGFMNLENAKQKTIEKFLKLNREDKYSGGDLIGIYHNYVSDKHEDLQKLLLLHNFEDIKGMLEILPILAVSDLFNEPIVVSKVAANRYPDAEKVIHTELLMTIELPTDFPVAFSSMKDQCYFAASKKEALLRVPVFEGELKYFFANYKDYYYLPDEDVALHKSVATFVDKDHREQAKASNCYTKKTSIYLPEWDALITPFFKKDYGTKPLFFELTDERKTDRTLFSNYAAHVLEHML